MPKARETPYTDRLLLRVEEAAELLGLSRATLYVMVAAQQIPVVHIGRAARIPADGLRKWVEQQTEQWQREVTAAESRRQGLP
jgi:excisionase family DNA binding protein